MVSQANGPMIAGAALSFAPADPVAQRCLLPLTVAGLRLRLGGRAVLDGIDFCLGPDGITAILGPNGAGKTLLLRALHGLLKPDQGQIDWNGLCPARARPGQGMVFQRPVMLRRSVRANICFALRAGRVPRRLRPERIAGALELTGLTCVADIPAPRLSGGEAQRLAIARAWAPRPGVLFLDEPTANLDPAGSREVEALVARVGAGRTRVLLTTHDLGQARRLADEVLFLSAGRLVEHSPAQRFFSPDGPATAKAAAFLRGELID